MSASVLGPVSQKRGLRQGFTASHLFIIISSRRSQEEGRRKNREEGGGEGKKQGCDTRRTPCVAGGPADAMGTWREVRQALHQPRQGNLLPHSCALPLALTRGGPAQALLGLQVSDLGKLCDAGHCEQSPWELERARGWCKGSEGLGSHRLCPLYPSPLPVKVFLLEAPPLGAQVRSPL